MSLSVQQLAERRTGLGASDAAAAIGLSRWKTPLQLYLEKIGLAQESDSEALHLEMGQALEPMIIARFEKKQRVTVTDRQRKFVDPTWPQRWVTTDGVASDRGMVEAKSVGMADPAEWGEEFEDGAVPMIYLVQSQHGLACTGLPFAWMPVVILNRQFRIYRIQRDEELIELITTKEREFMAMVEARTPPPPINLEDAQIMWPSHREGKRIEASDEIALTVAEFKASKQKMKDLEFSQETLKLRVQKAMGDAAELVYCGKVVCTWKQAKPSKKFNEDAFAIAHPDLYQQFQIEVPGSRRMLTK